MLFLADFSNFGVMNFKGELAALSAAFLWAIGTSVWSRVGQRIPPLELNLLKAAIAIAFLVLTILLQRQLPPFHPTAIGLLLLSGIIGIAISDTALFAALNLLGARRTLLLKILTSPLVALQALIFLQEKLSAAAWCSILLTLLGVAWVISERVAGTATTENYLLRGIGWAMLSTVTDATAATLSRAALIQTTISPLWSTLLRLSAGVVVLLVWLLVKGAGVQGRRGAEENLTFRYRSVLSGKLLAIITLTAFASTYLGIWLQQTALKFAPAGIAQTLGATSPLFVLPIAIWMGEKVSLRAFLGVVLALIGVTLLFCLR